jgi:hypothetical protein
VLRTCGIKLPITLGSSEILPLGARRQPGPRARDVALVGDGQRCGAGRQGGTPPAITSKARTASSTPATTEIPGAMTTRARTSMMIPNERSCRWPKSQPSVKLCAGASASSRCSRGLCWRQLRPPSPRHTSHSCFKVRRGTIWVNRNRVERDLGQNVLGFGSQNAFATSAKTFGFGNVFGC